jgi:hypothetical protein
MWGILSLGFILGGLFIAKKGLGVNLIRNLFRINIVLWTVSIFFTVQPSIILLAGGLLIYIFFIPFIEAIEQTIFQVVVPRERLGRVFGLLTLSRQPRLSRRFSSARLHSLYLFFMTTGRGVELIGGWFGGNRPGYRAGIHTAMRRSGCHPDSYALAALQASGCQIQRTQKIVTRLEEKRGVPGSQER